MLDELFWGPPDERPEVPHTEAHLWRASLDLRHERLQRLRNHLSPEERDRAGRFYFQRDRDRFVAGHGMLREVLGRYLGVHPAEVKYRYGPKGKPEVIRPENAESGVSFNMSHSDGVVVYALAPEGVPVGVDIELMRDIADLDGIVERFFSARERAAFSAASPERKRELFFCTWTVKEAYLKACGEGLSGLDAVEAEIFRDGRVEIVVGRGDRRPSAVAWSLYRFTPAPGYAGAMVAAGRRMGAVKRYDANGVLDAGNPEPSIQDRELGADTPHPATRNP